MTVEIEHVNTEILDILVSEGKQIHPKPSTIRMIQVTQIYCNRNFYFYQFTARTSFLTAAWNFQMREASDNSYTKLFLVY